MLRIVQYWNDKKTKWFYFQWYIYLLAIILSTVYAYARLDFVRSGPRKAETEVKKNTSKQEKI